MFARLPYKRYATAILLLLFFAITVTAQDSKRVEKNWNAVALALSEECKAAKNIVTLGLDYKHVTKETDSVTAYALSLMGRLRHTIAPDSTELSKMSNDYGKLETFTNKLIEKLNRDKKAATSKSLTVFTTAFETQCLRVVIAIADYNNACKENKRNDLLFPIQEEAATINFDK